MSDPKNPFEAMMAGTALNFNKGLGFKNWKLSSQAENPTVYGMTYPAKFPKDAVQYAPLIESVNLHNCKYKKIHRDIGVFKQVTHIDLSYNCISEVSGGLLRLGQLESLDLTYNEFTEFPKDVIKLTQLKKLDLRHQRNGYPPVPLVIPAEVAAALPACEILV